MYAYGAAWNGFHWWWLIPIAMMVLCFMMMNRHRGCMTGWSRSRRFRIGQGDPGQKVRPG